MVEIAPRDELQTELEQARLLRSTRGPRYDAAELGFRHYWYPALVSRELTTKPRAVKMLGEHLVFLRANGKAHALFDRCAHRGMVLSQGFCLTEGTITCPYHGWTYDVEDGRCVAALTDGPESSVPGKRGKRVRRYPVEERNGVVYVYMGDGNPPPLEEDVPEELLDPERYVTGLTVNTWACNWRASVENGHDAAHAPIVHVNSLRWRASFSLGPAWYSYVDNIVEGKYLYRRARHTGGMSNYPRVGRWPRYSWLRRKLAPLGKKAGTGIQNNSFRLPSMIRNGYTEYSMVRWVVPVDATSCRNFMWLTGTARGIDRVKWLAKYWFWHKWVFTTWFTEQDQQIVERLDYSAPEQLFRPDSSIVGLRKYIEENVRTRDPVPADAGN
jgi:phenylpropionate dioxygenase-like ring-hydroxylating dioxygenase large terminal subunit